MIAKNGHEVQLTGGIAIDGFDVFPAEYYPYYNSISTLSYNFSFGAGYRYYLAHEKYLGLRVKYNVVDYTLGNVIDFTGNPVTVQFIIGFLNNAYRTNNLKALRYPLRK